MKSENRVHAAYHFLGALFFVVPLLGFLAPALFYFFRKNPSVVEQNHYRGVLNFLISAFLYILGAYLIFPRSIAYVIVLIGGFMGLMMVLYAGFTAMKGQEVEYPLSIKFLKPVPEPTLSLEERMHSPSDQS